MHDTEEPGLHQRIRAAAAQELTSATIRVRLHGVSSQWTRGGGAWSRVASDTPVSRTSLAIPDASTTTDPPGTHGKHRDRATPAMPDSGQGRSSQLRPGRDP